MNSLEEVKEGLDVGVLRDRSVDNSMLDSRLKRATPLPTCLLDSGRDLRLAPSSDKRLELDRLRVVERPLSLGNRGHHVGNLIAIANLVRDTGDRVSGDGFDEQLVLRTESSINRSARQPGFSDDVLDLRARISTRGEDTCSRSEQLFTQRIDARHFRERGGIFRVG